MFCLNRVNKNKYLFLYLCNKSKIMKKKLNYNKSSKKKETLKTKKISKTWIAIEKLKGTGKILDMKAVLK